MISNKHPWVGLKLLCFGVFFITLFVVKHVGAESVKDALFTHRAEADFNRTKAQFLASTNGSPAAWQFARACYNLAEFATNDNRRADLAKQGIDACHKLLDANPKSGPAHYYLGMNLGQLARTEYIGALKLVKEMEREFKTAWMLDQKVDYAGAARSLGLLYREAPGWPASIGGKWKAREWLERSAKAAPEFPENLLVLTESYVKWQQPESAGEKFRQLAIIWPAAQTNFTGVAWEQDWDEWTARRAELQSKIEVQATPTAAPSNLRRPN